MLPAVACAYWRPLTNDEIFTFEIARKASLAEVWRALAAGADNHPPLDYILRHLSMSLFGQSELAFRLPSLVAVTAALAAIYSFVARRAGAVYGLMALLIPFSTTLFEYAYEARGYALLAAFGAVALAAWQRRTEGSRGAVILLAASLAAMLWTHYYGVLVFFPIALGELIRSWERRRIDWAVWIALAAGAAALVPLLPMIRAARQIGAVFWTKVGVVQALSIYPALMERLCIVAVVVGAVLLAIGLPPRVRAAGRGAKNYELAAVIGFVALPLMAYLLARAFTGALLPRYVLGTVVGAAIGFAFAASEALGDGAAPALLAVAVLALSGLGDEAALAFKQRQLRKELNGDDLSSVIARLPGPVVMEDNDLLMQLWHYEPAAIASRLFYVSDEKSALEYFGWNSTERALDGIKPWSQIVHVEHYPDFVRQEKRFVLIEGTPGYISQELVRDGAVLTAKAMYRNQWVFEVDLPDAPPSLSRQSNLSHVR
jgi:4-amino-4-deoxy-L-arabinose transferase-like glycosyltransferase